MKTRPAHILIALAGILVCALQGCAASKIILPTRQGEHFYQTPAQQEALSDAINDAISKISTAPFVDRKVYVETVGVMPHSDRDLLDYIADSARSHIAAAGAQIVFPTAQDKILLPPKPEDVDYFMVVAVESGGADNNVERSFLSFSGTRTLLAKARLRISAYPAAGGSAEVSTVSGIATRTYKRWIFWFFNQQTPYGPTSKPLF